MVIKGRTGNALAYSQAIIVFLIAPVCLLTKSNLTMNSMHTFFELPDTVLLEIYKKLQPQDLLNLIETGDTHFNHKVRRLAMRMLFEQKSYLTQLYQKKLLQLWVHTPNPLTPSPEILYKAIQDFDPFHLLLGLHVINGTTAYKSIQQSLSASLNPVNWRTILALAPTLAAEHIEQVLSSLQRTLEHGEYSYHESASHPLEALARKANRGHLLPIVIWVKNHLGHQHAKMRRLALKLITILENKASSSTYHFIINLGAA